MSKKVSMLFTILFVGAVGLLQTVSTYAAPPEGFDFTVAADAPYAPGELLVRFAPKAEGIQRSTAEKNQILSSLGGATIERSYKIVPGLTLVKLPAGQTVEDALETFNNANGILYAEPNYKITLDSTFPNDPRFDELWGMHNTGQTGGTPDADIDAPQAWDIHTGGSQIIVAAIDTGVDYNHPDLADNMWVNEAELNGDPNVDDDGNGYVDDVYGWDFADNDNDPDDYHSHGTHVAGTIGAVGNNGIGVTGVCWNIRIMALKIFPNYGEETFIDGAIDAIEYSVDNGAEVLNNSWGGGPYSQSLKDEISAADANGVLFVASAGNNGLDNDVYDHYPADYDVNNIISVMATNHDDNRWANSNWGQTSVDLAAPGSSILSCLPESIYGTKSGTSAAAPHVSGAAALIWTRNQALSHLEVKDIILNTVDQLSALDGRCVTGGRLNIYNAITTTPALTLSKADDVIDCVVPGDEIIYTISYGNPVNDVCAPNYLGTVNDVNIIDYLPEEIDQFDVSFSEPNGSYDILTNTVTWEIGTLSPNDSGFVTVTIRVDELAEPNGVITNYCEMESSSTYNTAKVNTPVCYWCGNIICVDVNAPTDYNTGISWEYAYKDLQDALDTARNCECKEIWVAAGTYYTHPEIGSSYWGIAFELVDGVPIYGGFAGVETNRSQRNPIKNETILEGDIDGDGYSDTNYLVKATDVNEATILDGFTIKHGFLAGILIDGASPTIRHNKITENKGGRSNCASSKMCLNKAKNYNIILEVQNPSKT